MRLLVPLVAAALLVLSAPVHSRQPAPDLATVLRDAANYLEQYEREVIAFTAHEDYTQTLTETAPQFSGEFRHVTSRHLRSELLILADATGWVELRDVFEVDGNKVRDRDERLKRLFSGPSADAKVQGYRIADESARFNLLPPFGTKVRLTLNVPMTALRYLRRANQARSSFSLGGVDRQGDTLVATVGFREQTLPPLVGFPENARARGTFWIEVGTGSVRKTQLSIEARFASARASVDYREQPGTHLWLPGAMDDSFSVGWTLAGRAIYSDYKQFKVETSDTVK